MLPWNSSSQFISISYILMLVALLFFAISAFRYKGEPGEAWAENILKKLEKHNYKVYGKVLRNIYIPKNNMGTSEIDLLFVTAKGIFVIESKNYSGWIFGSEEDLYWTSVLPSGKGNSIKNKFYNPIKQNDIHIKYLRQFLSVNYPNTNIPIYSIVLFSDRCTFKKLNVSSESHVIQMFQLIKTINKILEQQELSITNNQVDELYNELFKLTDKDGSLKKAHIQAINETKLVHSQSDGLVCPRCGSKLVIRTAKRGTRAGHQFYGCSTFPQCRYTKNIG